MFILLFIMILNGLLIVKYFRMNITLCLSLLIFIIARTWS